MARNSAKRYGTDSPCVLVQREMESWRSPLASIQPFRRPSLDDTAQCSSGWWTRQAAEAATGFKKEISWLVRRFTPISHRAPRRKTKLARKRNRTLRHRHGHRESCGPCSRGSTDSIGEIAPSATLDAACRLSGTSTAKPPIRRLPARVGQFQESRFTAPIPQAAANSAGKRWATRQDL